MSQTSKEENGVMPSTLAANAVSLGRQSQVMLNSVGTRGLGKHFTLQVGAADSFQTTCHRGCTNG